MLRTLLTCVVSLLVSCGERHTVVDDGSLVDLQRTDAVTGDQSRFDLGVDSGPRDGPVKTTLGCPSPGAKVYRVALRWDKATKTLSPDHCLAVNMTISGTKAPPFPAVLGTHTGTWFELLDSSGNILYQDQAQVFSVLCPMPGHVVPDVLAYLDIPNRPDGESFRFIDHECDQLGVVVGEFPVH